MEMTKIVSDLLAVKATISDSKTRIFDSKCEPSRKRRRISVELAEVADDYIVEKATMIDSNKCTVDSKRKPSKTI